MFVKAKFPRAICAVGCSEERGGRDRPALGPFGSPLPAPGYSAAVLGRGAGASLRCAVGADCGMAGRGPLHGRTSRPWHSCGEEGPHISSWGQIGPSRGRKPLRGPLPGRLRRNRLSAPAQTPHAPTPCDQRKWLPAVPSIGTRWLALQAGRGPFRAGCLGCLLSAKAVPLPYPHGGSCATFGDL